MMDKWVTKSLGGGSYLELTIPGHVVITLEARPDY
jgi:hypothetical protein